MKGMVNVKVSIKIIAIVAAVVLVAVGVFFLVCQSTYNGAISREENISQARSNITVQEKRRADLLPNLADCVKAYDKHEYETLMTVINARGASSDAAVNETQLILNAVAEAYPELRSDSNYKELMNEMATTENLIANYRSTYNSQVKEYVKHIKSFPNSWLLSVVGYKPEEYGYLDYDVSSDAPTNLFNN
jgi:LemA protein